jgi:hypothetical protein
MAISYLCFAEPSSNIPQVPKPFTYICGILNFILPGFGTILGCFLHIGASPEFDGIQKPHYLRDLGFGFLQMLTSWLIVGWIWSIYWGILFIKHPSRTVPYQFYFWKNQEKIDFFKPTEIFLDEVLDKE